MTCHHHIHIRLSSIKASFRDADHLPTTQRRLSKRGSMQTTRFQVTGPEYASDEDEGHDLLDGNGSGGDYDTKIYKSLRHFTREALPRLDNYRNIMSIQAQYRPTLDELHNATLSSKVSVVGSEDINNAWSIFEYQLGQVGGESCFTYCM